MKRILFLITAAALVGSASAEWSLFKDFEDGDNSDWSVASTNSETITAVGRVDIVDDPVASGQGKVAAIVNPIGSTDGSNSSMVLPLLSSPSLIRFRSRPSRPSISSFCARWWTVHRESSTPRLVSCPRRNGESLPGLPRR